MEEGHKSAKSASMGDFVGAFQTMLENPVSRFVLRRGISECAKDRASRAEVGLELYLGLRQDACPSCRLASYLVSFLVKSGAKTFGVGEEVMKKGLADEYWRKGLLNVIGGLAEFGVRRPFVPGAPFQIVWNITRECNLRCKHCYENAGKKDEDELPYDQVMRGIETISKANVSSLAFSGGEPTAHPSILQFIETAHDLGVYVSIATNGYNFAKRETVREYKDAGLGFAQISLDGLTPIIHDSFRGVKGSWEASVRAIKNCIAEDVVVCISTTVTEYNKLEVPAMLSFARDLGAKWYMLYNFIPTGRGLSMISQDLSPEERNEFLRRAFNANCKEMQVLSTAPQYAPVAKDLSKEGGETIVPTHFYNASYADQKMRPLADFIGGCGAGRFYLSIEPNGDIYPCVFLPHEPGLKLGNISDCDFQKIWKENELLHSLRDKDALKGHCPQCENRYICGGCRARAYAYFHDILAPDPGCVNNASYWIKLRESIEEEDIGREEEMTLHI